MTKPVVKSVEELNYEQASTELEAVLALLEAGDMPLEASLSAFERGQVLLKRCAALLERAELKVRALEVETPRAPEDQE
jgi:exodeoxyribonuclease VII small subunit